MSSSTVPSSSPTTAGASPRSSVVLVPAPDSRSLTVKRYLSLWLASLFPPICLSDHGTSTSPGFAQAAGEGVSVWEKMEIWAEWGFSGPVSFWCYPAQQKRHIVLLFKPGGVKRGSKNDLVASFSHEIRWGTCFRKCSVRVRPPPSSTQNANGMPRGIAAWLGFVKGQAGK